MLAKHIFSLPPKPKEIKQLIGGLQIKLCNKKIKYTYIIAITSTIFKLWLLRLRIRACLKPRKYLFTYPHYGGLSSAFRSGRQRGDQFLNLATTLQQALQARCQYCQDVCIFQISSLQPWSFLQPQGSHPVSWCALVHRILSIHCNLQNNFSIIWFDREDFHSDFKFPSKLRTKSI